MLSFTVLDQMRETDRALRKTGRDIERDRRELERDEKKLVCFNFHLILKDKNMYKAV
jgi:hypothetical protein